MVFNKGGLALDVYLPAWVRDLRLLNWEVQYLVAGVKHQGK